MTTLEKLKKYFNITDTSQDDLLNLIIDSVTELCTAWGTNSVCILPMCIEDYSNYLQSGNTAFEVSQPSDGLERYSNSTRAMIRSLTTIKTF